MDWKLIGYAISSCSVLFLGAAAWPGFLPGYDEPLLIAGMATSVAGMCCRYISHLKDEKAIAFAQGLARRGGAHAGKEVDNEEVVHPGGE